MQSNINIENMDRIEKLTMIEKLWDSLNQDNHKDLTPKWHLDVLKKRENSNNFIDLESSKKALKKLIK